MPTSASKHVIMTQTFREILKKNVQERPWQYKYSVGDEAFDNVVKKFSTGFYMVGDSPNKKQVHKMFDKSPTTVIQMCAKLGIKNTWGAMWEFLQDDVQT